MVKVKRGDCKLQVSRYNAAILDNFDPSLIQDPALRHVVLYLMNQVEELSARVKSQAEEI